MTVIPLPPRHSFDPAHRRASRLVLVRAIPEPSEQGCQVVSLLDRITGPDQPPDPITA
jgi:hypothetical protein